MLTIFQIAGDTSHLISIAVLLFKIFATKSSCSGISLKTQELYTLVFVMRYLDLLTDFQSAYLVVMKLVFIGSSLAIVWCIRWHPTVKQSYDRELDTFRHYFLMLLSFVFAFSVEELCAIDPFKCASYIPGRPSNRIFWVFSICLEAVAIHPQLVLLQNSGNVDNLTRQYIVFLWAYRAFYILNWICKYFTVRYFGRYLIPCIFGLVQAALYADFFYYDYVRWKKDAKLKASNDEVTEPTPDPDLSSQGQP